ncbi:hypothetical protein NGTWS1803_13960 [Mycolicibacterium cyprinidarum]|nr:hypothetical protein NGTWS1803_13960 [Mycolicibacterium sp. NGTWS1803]
MPYGICGDFVEILIDVHAYLEEGVLMAVEWRNRRSRRSDRRQAGSLPVTRWLQVGAATAGVSVALVAAPVALAETGTTSTGVDSSQVAGPSADTADGGAEVGSTDSGFADTSEESSGTPSVSESHEQEGPEASDEDGLGEESSDAGDISLENDPSPGQTSPELVAEHSSASADPPDTNEDRPASDADTVAPSESGSATSSAGNQVPTRSNAAKGPVESPSTPTEPMLLDTPAGPASMYDLETTPATEPTGLAQSAPRSTTAEAALPRSRPDYPESVTAPVTWRSILTEGLSWLGLGALAPNLPVPQFPVPDLIAGAWVGMRKLHHALLNSAPHLEPNSYVTDPHTGVITGLLGGSDADGDVITYAVTSAPAHGTVQIGEDGSYTYTPDSEFARTGGTDAFTIVAEDTGPANPWHIHPLSDLLAGLSRLLNVFGLATPPDASTATISLVQNPVACSDTVGDTCDAAPVNHAPSITVHNDSDNTIWIYNLPDSGDYSIPEDFVPVRIAKGGSAPVTLAIGTGALGTPENRIYVVEGDEGFSLPVDSSGGVDAFNPTAVTAGNSFLNYNFLEYFLYPAHGGYEYTIDTSYIDEWSLPIQFKFTIPHDADWTGAVSGKTYGFKDYDTVVSQLKAAGGPYQDLVWSGDTPWTPQPPSTVSRIIGPDKVWAQQSNQPASNIHMNNAGWVPTSYQDFVQYGPNTLPNKQVIYPYAYNGNEYSTTQNNFDFWRDEVAAPAGTPYPIALRTAAKLDGFPAVDGVYGFFTYPNDETAGQFTNIPTSVSIDIYVHGSSDGFSDSVIEGGKWLYSSSPSRSDAGLLKPGYNLLLGSDATDTFILDSVFKSRRATPLVIAQGQEHDIIAIDKTALAGATSNDVDIVDCFWFLGGGFANYDSQFVYDRSSGNLYYDQYPDRFGYSGVLANLSLSQIDPANAVFVL